MKHLRQFAFTASALLALAACAGTPGSDPGASQASDATASSLRLAQAARSAGDFGAAAALYRRLLASKGVDPSIGVRLGDTLLDAGSVDDAIDAYEHVPTGSKARVGALLGLERAYAILSEPAKAFAYADQAFALAPADPRVLVDRGIALDMLHRHGEAQDAYRAALAKNPRDPAARNDLALSLAMSGQFAEAVNIMAPIARSTNASPQARQNLALIYGLMGDENRAAALSRTDLDESVTRSNLSFFAFVRGQKN